MKKPCLPLLLLVLIFCASCTVPEKRKDAPPLLFASFDDFKRGPEGGVDLVWSTKRIDDAQALKEVLHKYDSLVLDQTWLVVDKTLSESLDDRQVLSLSRQMVNEIKSRLGHGFKLVKVPTENTLSLSIALSAVETSLPILAVTNRFLPMDRSAATLSKVVIVREPDVGRVTAELLVSDARTGEPLIAAIDTHFGDQDVGMMTASPDMARKAISSWADRLWTTLSYWNWLRERTPAL